MRVEAEGWYCDPYGVHGDRWFSVGHPTSLVRDDGVESHDAPPAGLPPGPLIESASRDPGSDDVHRADEQIEPYSREKVFRVVLDRTWVWNPRY